MGQGVSNIVLCGHSLGGGYAILTALEMVHTDPSSVTAVVTFGAPQVVREDSTNTTWANVNRITSLYVNNWDPVPRLPTAWNWIEKAAEIAPFGVAVQWALKTGGLTDFIQRQLLPLQHDFGQYDIIGTVHFISHGVKFSMVVPHANPEHRELLKKEPDDWGMWIAYQHACSEYIKALQELTP